MESVIMNGELRNRDQCLISFEDRGYQFGDGVYEVIRVYGGRPFLMEEHLHRFKRSADELKIRLAWDEQELALMFNELVAVNEVMDGKIYVQLTRGAAKRDHLFPGQAEPVLIAYTDPASRPLDKMNKGIRVMTVDDIRWLRVDIKSLNLLPNVLVRQQAHDAGADDAIFVRNGIVTEGSSSNVFGVKDGICYTHPAGNLILNGITRQKLLQLAEAHGIACVEQAFTRDQLLEMDEVFISGTISEVTPVIAVDGQPIGNGKPGAITAKFQEALAEAVRSACPSADIRM
ncbi:D-amino-acid transaminase [Paenibacillus beijingensis]|uniref:D-alanine aminotransferase n=1 Tax=Paenibacillus beijingensis TaxID=1126833 RepID=A0A0D5NHE0_9BACL|nr:D-amino-acid transaminase [Paenibacillus beijingensis]AJY74333.1 hypothetical protein VN24_06770 [Paenibacillus beijingensis]